MRNQNRRNWVIALSVIFALLNISCDKYRKTEETRFIMGTIVDIKIYRAEKEKARAVIKKAFDEIERIDKLFSHYKEDSIIAKINNNSGRWIEVPGEVLNLVDRAVKFSDLTGGAFDITIGPVVNLWGFGPSRNRRVPSRAEISDKLSLVNYKNIEIDKEKNRIKIKKGMRLDMGGIAKGYAVDCAVKILRENGINNALVNAGGDIFVMGEKKKEEFFNIGIQHPRKEKEIIQSLKVSDVSVITSGDYENYFIEDGKRYHHIFNPKTGYPSNLCQSVTIITRSHAVDILSTGIFVLGPEKGIELVESIPGAECFIIDESGKIIKSKGFDKYIAKTN
ncbi:MAG: FAD:protein FMN transferase [bacterium]